MASKDFCQDCGVLLTSHTSVCTACGFDNSDYSYSDICIDFDLDMDFMSDDADVLNHEVHSGF